MKDFMKFIAVCAVVIGAIIGVLVMLCSIPDRISCHSRWAGSRYETQYSIMGGCRVHIGDQWLPEDSIRNLQP